MTSPSLSRERVPAWAWGALQQGRAKGVILWGGVIDSPQLLQLSGVGNAEELGRPGHRRRPRPTGRRREHAGPTWSTTSSTAASSRSPRSGSPCTRRHVAVHGEVVCPFIGPVPRASRRPGLCAGEAAHPCRGRAHRACGGGGRAASVSPATRSPRPNGGAGLCWSGQRAEARHDASLPPPLPSPPRGLRFQAPLWPHGLVRKRRTGGSACLRSQAARGAQHVRRIRGRGRRGAGPDPAPPRAHVFLSGRPPCGCRRP